MLGEGREARCGALRRAGAVVWRLVPNIYAGIIATAAMLMACIALFLGYQWAFLSGNPVTEDAIVELRPADGRIRREAGVAASFGIVRRVCSERTTQAEIIRHWAEVAYADRPDRTRAVSGVIEERPVSDAIVVFSSQTTTIRAGCHTYSIEQMVPENLRPAQYAYEASLRFCSNTFSCSTHRLQEVRLSVSGGGWPVPDPGPPPPTPLWRGGEGGR